METKSLHQKYKLMFFYVNFFVNFFVNFISIYYVVFSVHVRRMQLQDKAFFIQVKC